MDSASGYFFGRSKWERKINQRLLLWPGKGFSSSKSCHLGFLIYLPRFRDSWLRFWWFYNSKSPLSTQITYSGLKLAFKVSMVSEISQVSWWCSNKEGHWMWPWEGGGAIQHRPVPATVNKVRQCIGFAAYCHKFIPNFSNIAKPLPNLPRSLLAKSGIKTVKGLSRSSRISWTLSQYCHIQWGWGWLCSGHRC